MFKEPIPINDDVISFFLVKFKRDDVNGGLETKMFLHISKEELEETIESYKPVVDEITEFQSEEEFLDFIQKFRD